MIHLRIVAPPALADGAYRVLHEHASALNVVRLRGAAEQPAGDLILCDVAREDASVVVAELRELGLERDGSIALEPVSSLVSDAARRAEQAAVGSPADAVVWETVEFQTSESADLSGSFLVLMALATMIAALGIIQDSLILIIGAMVVGPEFGPLAGALRRARPATARPRAALPRCSRRRLPRRHRRGARADPRPAGGRVGARLRRRRLPPRDALHLAP